MGDNSEENMRLLDPGDRVVDLHAQWIILVRRRVLVLGVCAAMVGGALAVSARATRIYDAACSLIIDVNPPRVLDKEQVQEVAESGTAYWYTKEFYETQYKVINSRGVAERVVQQLDLAQNAKFLGVDKIRDVAEREKAMKKADPAAALLGRLKVEPVKDSRVVRIRVEDESPEMAATLANAVAEAYIAENQEVRSSITRRAVEWLESQVGELQAKNEESAKGLYAFKEQNDIVFTSWEDKQSMTSQRLTALNDLLTKTRAQKAQLQARFDAIEAVRKSADPVETLGDSLQPIASNVLIQNLKLQYATTKNECADLEERLLDKHPKLIACQAKLEFARKNLHDEIWKALDAAQSEYREAVQTEKNLLALYNEAKEEAFRLNQHEVQYTELKRAVEGNQRLYDLVVKRLKDATLAGALQISNVRVLERALPKLQPIRPNLKLNLLVGLILGLLGGITLAFAIEFLDRTIQTQEQLESRLGITFLGILPRLEGSTPRDKAETYVQDHPKSAFAECCRSIRTNILFMSPDLPLKTVLVTSGGMEDGKTTTAVNLAIAMAESGNKVLLVDSDMRRPRIDRVFNVSNEQGLSSLVVGQGSLDGCVKSTEVRGLFVLPCGPIPPNPAELLHTEAFRTLLKEMETKFDRVVLDSAPAGLVADAVVLATLVSGTLLVIKAGQTTRELAVRTTRALTGVNAKILGGILNDLNLQDKKYAYYYSRYGYYTR